MKHGKILLIAFLATGIFVWSCAKDGLENGTVRTGPSNGTLGAYLSQIAPTQTFTFNNSSGGTIYGARGTRLDIQPGAFVLPNWTPASGNITIELIEVLGKKEMIGSGAFTTSGGVPIQSGGEIKLTAWQGSMPLEIAYTGAVTANIPAGNNPISGMNVFSADTIDADQDFDLRDSIAVNITVDTSWQGPVMYYYTTFPPNVGWTNCDQYMSGATTLVPFAVTFPSIFNQTNTACYISFNAYNTMMGMYYFDTDINAFESGGYMLPGGFDVTFIAISEIGGQFYYAEQQLIVGATCSISLVPQPCSQSYVDQKLSAL